MAKKSKTRRQPRATKQKPKRSGRPIGTGGKSAALTSDDIHRVDRCLTGTTHELRNRALLYFGLGTGMRIAELVGLTVGDESCAGTPTQRECPILEALDGDPSKGE